MSTIRSIEVARAKKKAATSQTLHWSPVFDTDRAADALADFLEAARSILEGMQEFSHQAQAFKPWRRARRNLLRHLARQGGEVEFHDLPHSAELSGSAGRALVQKLADEGLVEMRRDEAYPNMLYLRINPSGAKALRKILVKEAMEFLHGVDSRVTDAVGNASEALERLAEVVEAR